MIFFVHTPKTGGTTFESIIQNNVNFKNIGYFYPKIINFEDLLNYEKFVKESMRTDFEKKEKISFLTMLDIIRLGYMSFLILIFLISLLFVILSNILFLYLRLSKECH